MEKVTDVIVIGAGIAGLTAGIYLKRAARDFVLLDKGAPGGKLLNVHQIDNYPGTGTISGPELAQKVYKQAQDLGVEVEYGNIYEVKKDGDEFLVTTDIATYRCRAAIIATGLLNRLLGVPGEKEFLGHGVSYCATCDGAFYKGKDVAVIGNKDQAVEEAIYLAGLVHRLYFFYEGELIAPEEHLAALRSLNNVILVPGSRLLAIKGEKAVTGVDIQKEGGEQLYPVSGVFPLAGERSSADFLAGLGLENSHGFLKVGLDMATSLPGLYAAGDLVDQPLRQAITAAGEGATAASAAISYLRRLPAK